MKSDLFGHYSKIAKKVAQRYENEPGLKCILWIGSASYGFIDEYSDIDIRLVVDKTTNKPPMEQYKEKGIKIEVEHIHIDWLLSDENDPSTESFWIRESGIILHDPKQIYKNLFVEKNIVDASVYDDLTWNAYKMIFNSYEFKKTTARNQRANSLQYISKTLDALSVFLFAYHKQPIPTSKWRWAFIEKLELYDISKIITLTSHSLDESMQIFNQLVIVENSVQELMRKKGYSKQKVEEPWRF